MITPVRIQRTRQKKQISPNGLPILYVGRPSRYGNIYRVGNNVSYPGVYKTIEEVIEKYRWYINEKLKEDPHFLNALKGKNLSCWCKIGDPCHGDELLKIANK